MDKFESKNWILHFAWRVKHRVSLGCDWKNTEEGLEEKIKIINCIKCLLLLYLYRSSYIFIVVKNWINQQKNVEEMGLLLQSKFLLLKNVLLQPKLWNKIKTTYKLLHNGYPFNMYSIFSMHTEILVDIHICWMENNPGGHLWNGFKF